MDLIHTSRRISIFLPQGKGKEAGTPKHCLTTTCIIFQRIYTDADLYDPGDLAIVSESADQILADLENKAREEGVVLPPDIELVLEIVQQDGVSICGYYFVDHSSRCLFWLEQFDAEKMCEGNRVVVSLSHLREFDLIL